MKRTFWRKTLLLVMVVILLPVCVAVNTYACILFYAGGDMTDDGANMFVRTEEIGADDNKVYYVSPEGKHVKGEVYQGCTDFTWIFTHDSYRYTARCDGMPGGICLSCGESHNHTPYEEAGINDHGVTVSATQSLAANTGIQSADPFIEGGIEESVLGRIDLDDKDHVIASDHLIDVAKKAGTFVGEEEENIIDFRASYNDYRMEIENEDWSAEWKSLVRMRITTALDYLEGTDDWNIDDVLEDNAFVMTNMDEDGNITALHNQLTLKDTMSLENAITLFRTFPIGFEENVNTHLYRFYKEEEQVHRFLYIRTYSVPEAMAM